MLTCDDRRLLTELLGEVWWLPFGSGQTVYCNGIYVSPQENRTFTTWQDTGDLKKRIVEIGEWHEFIDYTLTEHGSLGPAFADEVKFYKAYYIDWLMDPIRFPELVAGWLKERRSK